MTFIGHSVGNACAKQGFDSTQQGQCDRRSEQLLDVAPADVWNFELRESLRNTAELGADGFDRKIKQRDQCRHDDQHDDGTRNSGKPPSPRCAADGPGTRPDKDDDQGSQSQADSIRIDGIDGAGQRFDLMEKVSRHLGNVQT